MEKLVLIDGNSLLNRAFYATPPFTNKEGFPTNAIFGFVKLLLKIASDKKPQYMAVAFDLHAPTFRHSMYSEYKAGRKPMPDELRVQVPALKELLSLMRIKTFELAGYEADDIIGTLSKRFPVQTYIYTGDRDAYQLVDKTTNVCFTKRGVSELLELNETNFTDETNLTPKQIIDLKALMGDSSDNIPGVAGVGEKTALSLLEKYQTLDGIYAHIDEIKGALQNKLIEGKEKAYFSYQLATIDTDVPLNASLSDCVFYNRYSSDVRSKFAEYDFRSMVDLDVFDQPEKVEETPIEIQIETPSSAEELIQNLANYKGDISLYFNGKELHLFAGKEYVMELKEDLLSLGLYLDDFLRVIRHVLSGANKVITYDLKALLTHFTGETISITATIEDVALMKYIKEGTGGADSLEYTLDYHSIPSNFKGYGLYKLYEIYHNSLDETEEKIYREIELPLLFVLFDMQRAGICVDEQMIDLLSKKYQAELKELTQQIYSLCGEEFNINSPAQLGKILFDKLQIGAGQTQKSKAKKNYSTSAEVLEQFAPESEVVRLILRYRQVQKLNSTYLEGFKPYIKQGKIHTTYHQTVTSTGRLSSSNPNIQNIPVRSEEGKEFRKLFKASEGNVLIDADYSQIELRLLAHISNCKPLQEAYREGKDIHTATASQVFNVPEENVSATLRREAKAVNFGIIYGISAFGLSKDLGISTKRAKEYIESYFLRYPEVKTYMTESVAKATQTGFVQTICGRKRVIPELKSSNHITRAFGERAAMNMPLQGSSADIIKIAMIRVHQRLKEEGLKGKLVLQIHDELILDVPKAETERAKKILQEEMENAATLNVPLLVDVNVGENWYDAH